MVTWTLKGVLVAVSCLGVGLKTLDGFSGGGVFTGLLGGGGVELALITSGVLEEEALLLLNFEGVGLLVLTGLAGGKLDETSDGAFMLCFVAGVDEGAVLFFKNEGLGGGVCCRSLLLISMFT